MDRRDFIKISTLGALGTLFLPSFSFSENYDYSIDELFGLKNSNLEGDNFRLLPKPAQAFRDMRTDATKVGIKIYSQSSYRSYYRQKGIWERKYRAYVHSGLKPIDAINKIIEYSTIPGTSRHHWGTDLDIVDHAKPIPSDPLNPKHFAKGELYEELFEWLSANAEKYDFYLAYTEDSNRKGFKYEPWHYSHKEESVPRLKALLELDITKELQNRALIGSDSFSTDFISKYIQENLRGINKALMV